MKDLKRIDPGVGKFLTFIKLLFDLYPRYCKSHRPLALPQTSDWTTFWASIIQTLGHEFSITDIRLTLLIF